VIVNTSEYLLASLYFTSFNEFGNMILIYESTNLFYIYFIIFEHILALFTIYSNIEGYSSS